MDTRQAKLLELWLGRKQRAHERRQLYEQRWLDCWGWYRGTRKTERLENQFWQRNNILPDAFRVVETMVPQHVLGMFRSPEWFSVEAPTVAGETYQNTVKSLLLSGWRKMDGYRKTIEAVKYGAIMGHFCAKVYWDVQLGEREVQDLAFEYDASGEQISPKFVRRTVPDVRHNGPQLVIPDLFYLWQDPTGREGWWIEKIPSSLGQLRAENRSFEENGGGRLYVGLENGIEPLPAGGFAYGDSEGTPLSLLEGIPEELSREPDHVELWQCWGWVPPEVTRYDDTQWRLHVIANRSKLIRDVPCPTPDRRPPYINVPAIPIPHDLYGDSPIRQIGPLIDIHSFHENALCDLVELNMFPQVVIDNSRADVGPNDLFKMPGGALFLDTNGQADVNQVFSVVPRPPVMPEAWQWAAQKEYQIFATAGTTEILQGLGMTSKSRDVSATESQITANNGLNRVSLATMWLDETFKRRVLERCFRLYQSKLTTPETVEMSGDPNFRPEVTLEDLQWDVDIYVDSGLFGSMDQSQLSAITQLYGAFAADPATAPYLKAGPIIRDVFYRAGFARAAKYVRTEDEVAQIQAQQQQQQLLLAALEGGTAEGAGAGTAG